VRHTWTSLPCVTAKYRPLGENCTSYTLSLKLKWCRTTRRRKLTSTARPTSSTESSSEAVGDRAIRAMSLRFSKGNVLDRLLHTNPPATLVRLVQSQPAAKRERGYLTRSNTVTRLPTGLTRLLPSGVNSTLPCLYTVPQRLAN